MDKKFKIAAVAVPFATLTAITIAFAISGKPKAEAGELRRASAPATEHLNKNVKPDSHRAGEEHEGEEDDDEEKDDSPIAANLTPDQAKAAALAVQPGTAGEVELENEDGKPVYSVDVVAADQQKYEVEVDGNTGKVLKSAVDKEDGPDGDGDGEEKDD